MSPPPDRPPVRDDEATAHLRGPTGGERGGSFSPGDLLAGRFRVVRFLAAGGMGEVWEVDDTELGERLAIKTIRPQIAEDELAMARFRREVQLARRVTHPSVCRTFDIFRHGHVSFVSMELIAGDTLRSEIQRRGRLTPEEALPIVTQVAGALAAAHDQGIVHRDLKSANVMLTASPRGLRAVVTDFGLARLRSSESDAGGTLTVAGMMMGTPATMAPEQVAGGEITPASDVYALGLLLYEMVTGRLPFDGDGPLTVALRRLNEDPPPPSRFAEGLDPRWEAAILRCLERDPARRFADVGELVRALGGELATWHGSVSAAPAPTPRRRRGLAWAGLGIAVAVVVAGGFVAWRLDRPKPPDPADNVPAARRSVAVLGFQNLSRRDELDWLSPALAEMLAVELAADDVLRTVPGETVARMQLELELPDVASLAPETIGRIHRHLGSDFLVTGSYLSTPGDGGGRLRLDLRVEDARTATTLAQLTETGGDAELLDLVSRSGERLRRALGLAGGVHDKRLGTLPRKPEAARLYVEGLVALRHFEALRARDLFLEAIRVEPDSPLVHSALAEAWTALGVDLEAAEEAKLALDLGGDLSREDRLLIEGRYHASRSEWGEAIAVFRSLHAFYPDHLEHGLRLAEAEVEGGEPQKAVETLERLRSLGEPDGTDPRIDLLEAHATEVLSDFASSTAAAERALDRSQARGARWLVAHAHNRLARAHWRRRDYPPALAEIAVARELYRTLGDAVGDAQGLVLQGNVLRNQGKRDEGRAALEEALAVFRRVGDASGESNALNNLALTYQDVGDLVVAEKLFREALAGSRARNDKYALAIELNNLAAVVRRLGRLAEARDLLSEALQVSRELGDRPGIAIRASNLGAQLRRLGDFDGALALYLEALSMTRESGEVARLPSRLNNLAWIHLKRGELSAARKNLTEAAALLPAEPIATTAAIENTWGALLAEMGDFAGARARFEAALALRERLSLGQVETDVVDLIGLDVEEGLLAAAEKRARSLLERAEGPIPPCDQLAVRDSLLRARLEAGNVDAATEAARAGDEVATSCEEMERLASHTLAKAQLLAATGRQREARESLEAVLIQTTRAGWPRGRFEAFLGLAAVDLAAGQRQAAVERLREIEADAAALGLHALANRARRALATAESRR